MIVLNWVTYLNELFSDFPAEDSRVFLLVLLDLIRVKVARGIPQRPQKIQEASRGPPRSSPKASVRPPEGAPRVLGTPKLIDKITEKTTIVIQSSVGAMRALELLVPEQ